MTRQGPKTDVTIFMVVAFVTYVLIGEFDLETLPFVLVLIAAFASILVVIPWAINKMWPPRDQ